MRYIYNVMIGGKMKCADTTVPTCQTYVPQKGAMFVVGKKSGNNFSGKRTREFSKVPACQ